MKIKSIFLSILLLGVFAPQLFASQSIRAKMGAFFGNPVQKSIQFMKQKKVLIAGAVAVAGVNGAYVYNLHGQLEDSQKEVKKEAELKQAQEFLEKNEEFAQFVTRYRCSPEDEKKVHDGDITVGYLKSKRYGNSKKKAFRSMQLDRIQNACKLKRIIHQYKLDHLDVAEKCLCHMDNDQWRVLSKTVDVASTDQKISLEEVQQLVKISQLTGFYDWGLSRPDGCNNIIRRSTDKKLVFIDTENIGFKRDGFKEEYAVNPYFFAIYNILRGVENMTPEALVWLESEYTKILPQYQNQIGALILRNDENTKVLQQLQSDNPTLPCNQKYEGDCVALSSEVEKVLDSASRPCPYDRVFSQIKL